MLIPKVTQKKGAFFERDIEKLGYFMLIPKVTKKNTPKYAPPPPPPPPTHHNKGTGRRVSKFPNDKISKIATKTIGPTRRVLQGTLLWGIKYVP